MIERRGDLKKNPNRKMTEPKTKFRSGNISASIFSNEGEKDGKKFSYDTIQLQRSYKDKKDNWVNEKMNIRKTDISKLLVVLGKVQESIFLNEKE